MSLQLTHRMSDRGRIARQGDIMINRLGAQIGNYRLVRKIGQGGFAEVYLGEHIYLRTQAAIKILQMRLAEHDMQSFLNEARTIAHLIHPNIVRVMDFGVEHETPFLVMDYAPNGTLRQHYPNGSRLPLNNIVSYVNQIASALQYAHDQRLIHRDIKPENMLVGRNNEILLSDFGIALVAQTSRYQSTQEVVGTLGYIAPEQIQGRARPASDQYSLGIVVYEWLCGDRPFQGSFTELCAQHMYATPPPLREKVSTISLLIEQVIQRALVKDPYQRFPTIQDFARAFEQACQFQQATPLPSTPNPQVSSPQYGQLPQQLSQFATIPQFSSLHPHNATPLPPQQLGRPLPFSPQPPTITPPLPQQPVRLPSLPSQQPARSSPQQSLGNMPYAPPQPSAGFSPYPQQQSMESAPYIQQQPSIMAPFPPAQYPGTAPPIGTRPAVNNGYQAYGVTPAASSSPWARLTTRRPAVAISKVRVWSIHLPQIVAMIIGAILFGVLSHIAAYWSFNTSGSNFLNNGFVLPALVISLFFGALFGPWVGAVSGGLGAFIGDYIFMFYLDHYASSSILNNGIWHGSPLTNVSVWIGFTLRTDTNWIWILSNASIGFIAGLAMIATRGRYVTIGRIALAELLSTVAILADLGLLIASNAWQPGIPYYNLIHYPTADALNVGFTHLILPTLAFALTALSFFLPLTNAFTRSRE